MLTMPRGAAVQGVEAPMVHLGACLASMACRADQRECLGLPPLLPAAAAVSNGSLPPGWRPAGCSCPSPCPAPCPAAWAGLWAVLGRQRWLHRALAGRRKGDELPADGARLALAAGGLQHENREEREAVSAGAAAGIAAAFGGFDTGWAPASCHFLGAGAWQHRKARMQAEQLAAPGPLLA